MSKTVETWLPVFPGFYETGFYDDDKYADEVKQLKADIFTENNAANGDIVDAIADELDYDGLVRWDNKRFEADSAVQGKVPVCGDFSKCVVSA